MKTNHTHIMISLILILVSVVLPSCTLPFLSNKPGFKSRYREPFIPTDLPPTPPYFLPSECRFPIPPGEVRCGDLYVYEDRSDPASRVISLHVSIFPSFNPDPKPDPLIYLLGGGGADALSYAEFYLGTTGTTVRTDRDFILYNQRGVKFSDPHLSCPDEEKFWKEVYTQNLSWAELQEREIEFLNECRQSLSDKGINPDHYDSLAHAADLADLITALGYEQANIYGVSYGTRTGLTLMRHYPELIRSAILDGVLPPQINYPSDAILSFAGALETLFAGCAEQPQCKEIYPDLDGDLNLTLKNLKSEPVELILNKQAITLDHSLFLEAIFHLTHSSSALENFPAAIHDASQGNYSWFYDTLYNNRTYSDFINTGVNYSTVCRDEVYFDSLENNQELVSPYPETWQEFLDLSFYYTVCQDWVGQPSDPVENTPVESNIPTLLLSGHFDPITSPAWSLETAGYLENSFEYEFPNLSHGVLRFDSCALKIGLDFLADPWTEPDSRCLDELGPPEFK